MNLYTMHEIQGKGSGSDTSVDARVLSDDGFGGTGLSGLGLTISSA